MFIFRVTSNLYVTVFHEWSDSASVPTTSLGWWRYGTTGRGKNFFPKGVILDLEETKTWVKEKINLCLLENKY